MFVSILRLHYSLKGMAAYASHAQLLGKEDLKTYANIQSTLSFLGSKYLERVLLSWRLMFGHTGNHDAASADRAQLLQQGLGVGAANLNVCTVRVST